MTSYKLAQFVKDYIQKNRPDLTGGIGETDNIENAIVAGHAIDNDRPNPVGQRADIRSRTARRWLHRLGYRWQDVKKGVFFDGHERPDVVEYRQQFVAEMHRLSPYLVEFESDGTIKDKPYPADCEVGGSKYRPIIVITHDESIFSANDGKQKAWGTENQIFLRPKGKGRGIMVSDFLLPWSRLNLLSLPRARQEELQSLGIPLEAAVLYEYGKDEGYWDGKMLLEQAVHRALPIAEALYPGYKFLFLFDNATSHSVYAPDALRASKMNKGDGGQQPFIRNGWFHDGETIRQQGMWYMKEDPHSGQQTRTQKGVERVLRERELWPRVDLNLECPKPKCLDCQAIADCKICVKGKRCDSCKTPKVHSNTNCGNGRSCDACDERKRRCKCTRKVYCPRCANQKQGKCQECENMPPKCTSNDCCARRLLSIQPDFSGQKCELEEKLEGSGGHCVMYYPKFHCELNHIEKFWCHGKRFARENCDYTLDGLRRNVPLALVHVKNSTILGNFKSCMRMMELYRQGVAYGTGEWKKLTSHQRAYIPGEDR